MNRLLILILALALAACSSTDDKDLEPLELVDFNSDLNLKEEWSADVGSGTGDFFGRLPMVLSDNTLFAVDSEGEVEAFNIETGKRLWDTDLDQQVGSGVGAGGNAVFVGTLKGKVIALDSSTGEVLWRSRVSSEVLSQVHSNGSEVAVQTVDGRLYGLNAKDGKRLWMYDTNVPALTLRGTSSPIVTPTTVYAAFSNGKLVALNVKDGTLMWQQRVAVPQGRSELERVVDINAAPLLVSDVLYCGSYQGRIVAINRGTGRGIWAQKESTYTALSAANGKVFVTSADDVVKAYDAESGRLLWENKQLLRRQLAAPQAFGDFVAVADFEGFIHVMNQTDGTFVARRKVDGDGVSSPMAARGDTLFVYGNSGELQALKVR